MYIKRIELSGFKDDQTDGALSGSVSLVTDHRRIQIPLTVPSKFEMLNQRHRLRLLAMALKRARRMPEHRSGETIQFAPGLLPFGLTEVEERGLTSTAAAPKSGQIPFRHRKVPPCPPNPPMTV